MYESLCVDVKVERGFSFLSSRTTFHTFMSISFTYAKIARHWKSRGGYSHTLPIRVCAAQRGHDFKAPDLERGIHFRGVF